MRASGDVRGRFSVVISRLTMLNCSPICEEDVVCGPLFVSNRGKTRKIIFLSLSLQNSGGFWRDVYINEKKRNDYDDFHRVILSLETRNDSHVRGRHSPICLFIYPGLRSLCPEGGKETIRTFSMRCSYWGEEVFFLSLAFPKLFFMQK